MFLPGAFFCVRILLFFAVIKAYTALPGVFQGDWSWKLRKK
jgi:hypothetical protein